LLMWVIEWVIMVIVGEIVAMMRACRIRERVSCGQPCAG
jgi:hypothetical protein